jgi:N-acetylmuramoyl-L-alanine amidase
MASIDRGIRHRGYWVLRKNRLPAILVECGFLTNPRRLPGSAIPIRVNASREQLPTQLCGTISGSSGVGEAAETNKKLGVLCLTRILRCVTHVTYASL